MTDTVTKLDKRKSPEHKEHLRQIGFKKNDPVTLERIKGGSTKYTEELKAAVAEHSLDALAVVVDIMKNGANEHAKLKAATYILEICVAKAAREIKVTKEYSVADLLAQVNATNPDMMIDITPEIDDK
ncbi:hypothetical protein [Agrobacterium tumefaciens]|uniref:hypothetical protein n=1 Tax=Agrobacterium tumefaciens TaxID=358 RepID=UPI0015742A57|nr:hypothetical protein [Agrobacterium tumefaciens]WCJ63801.1 hypothetical protein G6M15_06300 [Agrobacterium tumefaciens]